MGALRGRSANAVVAHGVTKEMLWRPLRSHCVYTALIRRFYGVFTAYHLPYCVSVAFARRPWRSRLRSRGAFIAFARHFNGVRCAPRRLRSRGASTAFNPVL